MRKILLLIILLILILPVVAAGSLKPDLSDIIATTPAAENVSVIILFEETPTPADISIIKSDGASIKYQYIIIDAVAAQVPAQAADKIAKRAFVKLVEPDYKVKLVLDKSIPQIQADKVWEVGITGKNIDVAILDTGIHDEHPALIIEKEIDYTREGTDDLHGHGTHVAGIVASSDSTYRGVAYDADLFNVKVLNKDGSGYGSDVIKGIEWSVDNGAEIISMSLGAEIDNCDGTDAISRAVDKAVNKGVVAVVAAGNDGPNEGTITTPGCSKKGIAVGAVDDNDNVPSWSSRGPTDDGRVKPDLVAPGVNIKSTWKDNSFKDLSGTSMSTPHVSGVAALLLETDSSLKPDDVKNALKSTAFDLGLDENTQDSGRVEAYEAYVYVANVTKEPENETEENDTEEGKGPGFVPPGFEKRGGVKPGSFFYGIDRFFERISLAFTFNKAKKAEKHLGYAEERLAEAYELSEGNPNDERISELIDEYGEGLSDSNRISEIARGLGENTTTVDELVAEATSIHLRILGEVYNKVPEQARPGIEKAMETSTRGREEAVNVLRSGSGKEETSEEETYIEEPVENETEEGSKELDEVLNGLENPAKSKIREVQERVKSETQRGSSQASSAGASSGSAGSSASSGRGRP